MCRELLETHGIKAVTMLLEFDDESPPLPPLPDDHPCASCCVLDTRSGKPYCFLPKCGKEIYNKIGDLENETD